MRILNTVYDMERIERTPIGFLAYEQILQGVLDGVYEAGRWLKDTELAEALGISRTPVREALLRLTQEHILENRPGRGFAVRLMDSREAAETYPILWTIEGLAVTLLDRVSEEDLKALEFLNGLLAASAENPEASLRIDSDWHSLLVDIVANERLTAVARSLRLVVMRYECAFMRETGRVAQSVNDHTDLIAALEQGDMQRAAAMLKEHWQRSLAAIVQGSS